MQQRHPARTRKGPGKRALHEAFPPPPPAHSAAAWAHSHGKLALQRPNHEGTGDLRHVHLPKVRVLQERPSSSPGSSSQSRPGASSTMRKHQYCNDSSKASSSLPPFSRAWPHRDNPCDGLEESCPTRVWGPAFLALWPGPCLSSHRASTPCAWCFDCPGPASPPVWLCPKPANHFQPFCASMQRRCTTSAIGVGSTTARRSRQ